jgi:type 1 glutamine amidotransferase
VTRALVLHGGWEGHEPDRAADFATSRLLAGFDVEQSDDLAVLDREVLAGFDLIVPIWTFGSLTDGQCAALVDAVTGGLGLVSWHGGASSFLSSRAHKFLLGGMFVAHPGGGDVTYTVELLGNDPLVEGLDDVTVTSEQSYLLVDPGVKVLATTIVEGPGMPWTAGVRMPVAWTRSWGVGRVFYCSLGHSVDVLEIPSVTTLLGRAVQWAARTPDVGDRAAP